MAVSKSYKKNQQFFFNAVLLLVAAVMAVGVASFLTKPTTNLNDQSVARYRLGDIGGTVQCDSFPCWKVLMDVQKKYLTKDLTWMKNMTNTASRNRQELTETDVEKKMQTDVRLCIGKYLGKEMGDKWVRSVKTQEVVQVKTNELKQIAACLNDPQALLNSTQ